MTLRTRARRRESPGFRKQPAGRKPPVRQQGTWTIQNVIDASPTNVAVLDHRGVIRYVNQAWRRYGKAHGFQSRADGVGLKYVDLCRQADLMEAGAIRKISRKLASLLDRTASRFTCRYPCLACGKTAGCRLHGSRLRGPGESDPSSGTWILIVDEHRLPIQPILTPPHDRVHPLTEPRPRRLHESVMDVSVDTQPPERETLFRLLSEAIDEIFWFIGINPERVLYISPAVETIMGRKAAEYYGDARFWLTCVHEQDRARVEQAYTAWLAGEVSDYREQYRVRRPDDTVCWLDDHGALIHDPEGHITFATGVAKDITEQKHNEEMLRRLTARLITAQEAERSRIARELHDHVNQTLALLSIELEQLGLVPPSSPARQDAMQTIQQRLKVLSSDIHAMSHRLHPSKLKHLGLVSAVRALCRDMEEGGLRVRFADRDIPRTLPDDAALTLYRVVQEGLQNAKKHSGVESVELTLTRQSSVVTLRLRDRGKGFDPSGLESSEGLGLVSMTERIGSVGGTLAIRSAPGVGTEIEASVPIQPERAME